MITSTQATVVAFYEADDPAVIHCIDCVLSYRAVRNSALLAVTRYELEDNEDYQQSGLWCDTCGKELVARAEPEYTDPREDAAELADIHGDVLRDEAKDDALTTPLSADSMEDDNE